MFKQKEDGWRSRIKYNRDNPYSISQTSTNYKESYNFLIKLSYLSKKLQNYQTSMYSRNCQYFFFIFKLMNNQK